MPPKTISISSSLNTLLALTVLFPFVPAIIRSSDTQPTFLAIFAVSLLVAFAAPYVGQHAYRITLPGATGLTLLVLVLFASLVLANLSHPDATIPSRFVSFAQFAAAIVWARTAKYKLTDRQLVGAVLVYALFTVIYFATDGALEDALIRSRGERAEALFAAGRGARTLSPEPSFFAIQVFNIFVLWRVLRFDQTADARRTRWFVPLVAACLAASLSAYGLLLLLVVLFATYPRTFAVGTAVLGLSFGTLYSQLPNWDSVRAVKVLLALIESKGSIAQLMLLDRSFSSRMLSFIEYVNSFVASPFVGEGFSLFQGGGFVSIISAVGLLGLGFFIVIAVRILTSHFRLTTTVVLLAWFLLNFISGPIGVPILGVIVGSVLLASREASRAATRVHTSAVLAT